ncbi:MAG: plasmid pRiA4b ORF-3 family protein [Oculatellaceae cyanobacterium Prado106]|jgi:hypothetical protein|nr:plasmid pRiA4b ORF-3 family protein [Oculatellaceae cyanobacterium Prado106]
MAKTKKSEDVPQGMKEKFDRIVAITDAVCQKHLNDEYAQLIRFATAALCRKRPSPLASGQDKTWACGITHAIGMINFLFDPAQDPHISSKDLYAAFEVSASSGQAKSKQVRDVLGAHQMDPDWSLPSHIDRNPLVWMITFNGLIMDARSAPLQIQQMAYAKGLIPYIPALGQEATLEQASRTGQAGGKKARTASKGKSKKGVEGQTAPSSSEALYVLEVFIVSGPISDKFVAKNPVISRRIEIKGSQTLADLHKIIFEAFDREEEHMYEFQIGGQGPNDPNARRYGLKQAFALPLFAGEEEVEDVATTPIASLSLSEGDAFGYWFDFGDDWWHQINVVAIADEVPPGKYPKITQREGKSPPQYADL